MPREWAAAAARMSGCLSADLSIARPPQEVLETLKKCETRRRRVGGGFKTELLDPETGKWTTSEA